MTKGNGGFQLILSFKNAENNENVVFKQDGQRFGTSQRTLKLFSNAKYKIHIKAKPGGDFHNLHCGGSDLELIPDAPDSGEYTALWNTTGIDPNKKGERQDLLFILSGPAGSLRKQLQTKFYNRGDSHAEWGHKLEQLIWSCAVDATGAISVVDEQSL
ncbi:unnamed protein product [Bursaphelenchus okinawaensis]|uniref:CB1 cannabinoid receptor-interacting protein 1 n=1 Tax=Bursaphelenchus okinawaensis TaxID=465554 RepID=A0A811JW88_9BILA|nr:unnamed protein product [Bursaphelenchus okinawaensis]CAG9085964.1 unnamed protein product [Bursaphelenchus okinawaensis]